MKILVIDDLRNPLEWMKNDNDIVIARTSDDAMEILQGETAFDQIYFDHDLGGDDTTRPAALYLEELAYFGNAYPVGEVIVHTSNSTGGDWIVRGLKDHYNVKRVFAGDYFTQ